MIKALSRIVESRVEVFPNTEARKALPSRGSSLWWTQKPARALNVEICGLRAMGTGRVQGGAEEWKAGWTGTCFT